MSSKQFGSLFPSYLKISKFQKNKKPIKSVLLDQSIISGLGNIYADEVCYYSKINPVKQTSLLTDDDILKIIEDLIRKDIFKYYEISDN